MPNTRVRKGQALVLVTLALFAMCGLMGLAVDMGWSLFVEKSEQSAADSAALAAVMEAFAIGEQGPYVEGDSRTVSTASGDVVVSIAPNTQQPQPCTSGFLVQPATNNFGVGCVHAMQNGFSLDNARQNVRLELGDTSLLDDIGVDTHYWARVRIAQQVPQLFSAILGNTEGLVASTATAAIVDSIVRGSLLLINREGDALDIASGGRPEYGLNMMMNGGGTVTIGGGIVIASGANTSDGDSDSEYAGEISGNSTITAQYTSVRDQGEVDIQGAAQWLPTPVAAGMDGEEFLDPTAGKTNIPLYDGDNSIPQLVARPVYGNSLTPASFPGGANPGDPGHLPPGIYYSAVSNSGVTSATGQQLILNGNMQLYDDGTDGPLPRWIFVGGLQTQSGNSALGIGHGGLIVFAGAGSQSGGQTPYVLNFSANPTFADNETKNVAPTGIGEAVVLTGPEYQHVEDLINNASGVRANNLLAMYKGTQYGRTNITAGNKTGPIVNLHGLNGEHADFPAWLENYKSVVLWQDRQNSLVDYTDDGHINCGSDYALTCPNPDMTTADSDRTLLELGAQQDFNVWGVVYQPRGAFTHIQAGGADVGALQLVTGALRMQGSGTLNLGVLDRPLTIKIVALVQ